MSARCAPTLALVNAAREVLRGDAMERMMEGLRSCGEPREEALLSLADDVNVLYRD